MLGSKKIIDNREFARVAPKMRLKNSNFRHIDTGIAVVVGRGLILGRAVVVVATCRLFIVRILVFKTMCDVETGQLHLAVMMMRQGHKGLRRDAHHRQHPHKPPISNAFHRNKVTIFFLQRTLVPNLCYICR
jgi:hypothetical protein